MNSLGKHCHAYYPQDLRTMGWAFDTAFDALPADYKSLKGARRELALLIVRFFDEGVTDPAHLCRRSLEMCAPTNRLVSRFEKVTLLPDPGYRFSTREYEEQIIHWRPEMQSAPVMP
jgi:hypothetical protein